MGVVIAVYQVVGGHSTVDSRVAAFMPRRGGTGDMVYRVGWGTQDTMEALFSAICRAAPIANRNGVDVVNIVSNDLAAHFVALLAQPGARAALRGMVTRCFKPGTIIYLLVSDAVMTSLLSRGTHYQQTFQAARSANAHIRLSDHRPRVLDVNAR
ncbi:MAG: hypothetical protein JNL56_03190 [Alphaproteobacteria bacterium]|nr:hypothetical protein [Alphaproteobacteria bacterium]